MIQAKLKLGLQQLSAMVDGEQIVLGLVSLVITIRSSTSTFTLPKLSCFGIPVQALIFLLLPPIFWLWVRGSERG